ncbi:GNAT family N-acetyltransferase [Paenibacillus lupini]|uniref:GNAT family N-acetyltransferase n=1 Tax=Paenibacillus lupini TaxID=1450204 RepID=UPI001423DC48|nr:GNAT family N-acetyltransferase [Paenibacillus lupini]NIK21867.1 GNAT superfamily N-acetyltransferase [Paenibacillus lupini]
MNDFIITKVNQIDPNTLMQLVEESRSEGHRNLTRLITEYEDGTNRFDKEGEALFIAINSNKIVGVCGLNQDPYSDRQEIGRVRRLYVSPNVRRFGIGRMLMDFVIADARNHYQMLVLKTDNPIAHLFYQSIGFSVQTRSEKNSYILQLG